MLAVMHSCAAVVPVYGVHLCTYGYTPEKAKGCGKNDDPRSTFPPQAKMFARASNGQGISHAGACVKLEQMQGGGKVTIRASCVLSIRGLRHPAASQIGSLSRSMTSKTCGRSSTMRSSLVPTLRVVLSDRGDFRDSVPALHQAPRSHRPSACGNTGISHQSGARMADGAWDLMLGAQALSLLGRYQDEPEVRHSGKRLELARINCPGFCSGATEKEGSTCRIV